MLRGRRGPWLAQAEPHARGPRGRWDRPWGSETCRSTKGGGRRQAVLEQSMWEGNGEGRRVVFMDSSREDGRGGRIMRGASFSRAWLSAGLMLPLEAKPGLAQIPRTIGYQGVLTDASGSAVPDGDYSLTFRLYDVRTGGSPLWEEGQVVAVAKGVFNVMLGSVVPLALPFDRPYWLGVTVGGGVELSPRIPLTSSGYSFRAASTESIGGITAGGDLTGTYPNPTLAANAVTTAKIADGAVTQAKLAPGVSLPPGGCRRWRSRRDVPESHDRAGCCRHRKTCRQCGDFGEVCGWDDWHRRYCRRRGDGREAFGYRRQRRAGVQALRRQSCLGYGRDRRLRAAVPRLNQLRLACLRDHR